MQNYPELLSVLCLVNAPWLFGGLWKVVKNVVDDRTKAKIQFATTKKLKATLDPIVGEDMCEWLYGEVQDNLAASKAKRKKAYWLPPDPAVTKHDPRGTASYQSSPYYIRTPGDKHLETKEES